MAIRDKIAKNVQPHLQPGEQIQVVFAGQTMSGWVALFGVIFLLLGNAYRTVAVTDRRIVVFNSGKMTTTKAKSIVMEIPRGTQIGPASGLWWKCTTLGTKLCVHKRFHKDIEKADAYLAQAFAQLPAPPVAPLA